MEQVKALLPSGGAVDAVNAMELVKMFANTWLSLDAYDKSKLPKTGATKRQVEFTAEELKEALQKLKHELIAKSEATNIFEVNAEDKALPELSAIFFKHLTEKISILP